MERAGHDIRSSEEEWFRYFVKKPARRAPLINLGYFIRMKAVEKVLDEVELFKCMLTVVPYGDIWKENCR